MSLQFILEELKVKLKAEKQATKRGIVASEEV